MLLALLLLEWPDLFTGNDYFFFFRRELIVQFNPSSRPLLDIKYLAAVGAGLLVLDMN